MREDKHKVHNFENKHKAHKQIRRWKKDKRKTNQCMYHRKM